MNATLDIFTSISLKTLSMTISHTGPETEWIVITTTVVQWAKTLRKFEIINDGDTTLDTVRGLS